MTADPATFARALASTVPILIGADLLPQAIDTARTVAPAVLDRRPAHRTALGAPLRGLLEVGLHHALHTSDVTHLTLDLDEGAAPDLRQVANITSWLRPQLPDLFDPAQLPGAYPIDHGVAEPEGEWRYLLESDHIGYGPGLWPFTNLRKHNRPAEVRMSPGTELYAWNNEYAYLSPSFWTSVIVEASLQLYAGFDGVRHWVYDGKIRLRLARDAAEIHSEIPEPLRGQAQQKADRLLATIIEHRASRDHGVAEPLTAWQYFHTDTAAAGPELPGSADS